MIQALVAGAGLVPVFIAKRAKGGTGWRGVDNYDSGKPGAELLLTNLEGRTPRERSREIAYLRAESKLKRAVDHWSISLDPRLGKLTSDQWCEAARVFLDDMRYGDRCPFVVTRHSDEPQDHIHLAILRLRADDLTVVSDSHDFKRAHIAAAKCAEALRLKPLPQREDAKANPAQRDPQVRAGKRAKRRGIRQPVLGAVVDRLRLAVGRAVSPEDLVSKAHELGLELVLVRRGTAADASYQGTKVRAIGTEEFAKTSDLDRGLSWSKVLLRLEENARVQAKLRKQAEAVRERAARRAEEWWAAQQQRSKGATNMQPQRQQPTPTGDKLDNLDFLNGDASSSPGSLGELVDQKEKGVDADRDQFERAEREVGYELRLLSTKELLDLRRPGLAPMFLTAAAIERLIDLVLRVLSLGAIKRESVFSQAAAARQRLAEMADAELERRRRAPATARERRATLDEYERALKERADALRKGAFVRGLPRVDAGRSTAARRLELEAGFDRRQVRLGHETLVARRGALATEVAASKQIAAEKRASAGLGVVLPGRWAAVQDANADRPRRLAAAEARRAAAAAALQVCVDEIDAAERDEQQLAVEAVRAEEREGIAFTNELRELLQQARALAAQIERDRIAGVVRQLVAQTEGEEVEDSDSDEARRHQRRMADRG